MGVLICLESIPLTNARNLFSGQLISYVATNASKSTFTHVVGGEGGGARARTCSFFDGTKKYCCSGTSPVVVNTPQYQVSIASTTCFYSLPPASTFTSQEIVCNLGYILFSFKML